MTMIKIERVEDLPDWFRLEKYNNSENFKAIDWLRSLAIRAEILHIMNYEFDDEAEDDTLPDIILRVAEEAIFILRQSPLERTMPAKSNYWQYISNDNFLVGDKSVRPLKFGDLIEECNFNRSFGSAAALEKWEVLTDTDTHRLIKRKDIADTAVVLTGDGPPHHLVAVAVDLNSPDAIIEATFMRWLESERVKAKTTINRYRKPTHDRWTRYGVLPYLDLMIWAQEMDAIIPDRVMAAAITPLTDIGDDRLRKTVAPLANSLIADLSDLRALAILESHTQSATW
ncbi:hypothetical protein D3C81_608460 [compost metagenome]